MNKDRTGHDPGHHGAGTHKNPPSFLQHAWEKQRLAVLGRYFGAAGQEAGTGRDYRNLVPIVLVLVCVITFVYWLYGPVTDREENRYRARIAYLNQRQLWLVEQGFSQPVKTDDRVSEIVGWSKDGRWLAYCKKTAGRKGVYLWVTDHTGQRRMAVDTRPVVCRPRWAPGNSVLAYSTGSPRNQARIDGNLKLAALKNDTIVRSAVWPPGSGRLMDLAWASDGAALFVSMERTAAAPAVIEKVKLNGVRQTVYTFEQTNSVSDPLLLPFGATGLETSPDGRWLVFFVQPGSASLAADGCEIRYLPIRDNGSPGLLGTGLAYPEWLDWSSDGERLAMILGAGREASASKELTVSDAREQWKIHSLGTGSTVDMLPAWAANPEGGLFFVRRPMASEPLAAKKAGQPAIPGQQIWQWKPDQQTEVVTRPPKEQSDLFPQPSPNGRTLIFVRATNLNQGQLMRKDLASGKETVLTGQLGHDPGYYFNELPSWLQVHWVDTKAGSR